MPHWREMRRRGSLILREWRESATERRNHEKLESHESFGSDADWLLQGGRGWRTKSEAPGVVSHG